VDCGVACNGDNGAAANGGHSAATPAALMNGPGPSLGRFSICCPHTLPALAWLRLEAWQAANWRIFVAWAAWTAAK